MSAAVARGVGSWLICGVAAAHMEHRVLDAAVDRANKWHAPRLGATHAGAELRAASWADRRFLISRSQMQAAPRPHMRRLGALHGFR